MKQSARCRDSIRRRWRRRLEVLLFDAAIAVVARLPRRGVVSVARAASALASILARRDRRIALANLRLAFGDTLDEKARVKILRQSFECFALTSLDYFWFSRDSRNRLEREVAFDDSLMTWIRRGGPFIAVTAHFGNWEVPGKYAVALGVQLASVAKPLHNPAIDARVNRIRSRLGQTVVPREGALRSLVQVLRRGGIVALLLDQDTLPAEGGTFVPFFGVPVPVSNAVAMLAQRFSVPIVPIFCRAEAGGRYRCYAREALNPADVEGLSTEALTALITSAIEREIRSDPGQWLWMYKRWKRRQPGVDPARYPFYANC